MSQRSTVTCGLATVHLYIQACKINLVSQVTSQELSPQSINKSCKRFPPTYFSSLSPSSCTMVPPNCLHLSSNLLNSLLTLSTYLPCLLPNYLSKFFSKGNPDHVIPISTTRTQSGFKIETKINKMLSRAFPGLAPVLLLPPASHKPFCLSVWVTRSIFQSLTHPLTCRRGFAGRLWAAPATQVVGAIWAPLLGGINPHYTPSCHAAYDPKPWGTVQRA